MPLPPMPADPPVHSSYRAGALAAVRDAYVVLLPITLFGVAATLLGNFPIPAGRAWLEARFGLGWADAAEAVVQSTWGVLGLALAVTIASMVAQRAPRGMSREPLPPIWVAIGAMVNFTLCASATGPVTLQSFGTGSMLTGIVVGLATPALLRPLADWAPMRRLAIGYDSNPVFYHATRLTLPLVLLGLLSKAVAELVWRLPRPDAQWLAEAGARLDAEWLLTPLAVAVNQCLWFFGVHGGKVLDAHFGFLFTLAGEPAVPGRVPRVLVDNFVHLGGSGATLGLLVALFIVARHGQNRRLAQLSWLPALFNVNELLLFGLPLVLNPRFLLPFLLGPLVLVLPPLLALHLGWIELLPVQIPWTTPVLLSGWWLTGSWVGAALQALGLVISTAIYLPFVRRHEAERRAERLSAFQHASAVIVSEAPRSDTPLRRSDHVGVIARGLLHDLERAIGTPALALVYQPQHRADGAVVGVEALLRWQHAGYGAVRPDVAIALAEQGAVIAPLGAWVIDRACACKAQWNTQGLGALTMSVNVSPLQLSQPGLHLVVAQALHRHGLRPDELELEITESRGIPVGEVADANLARLDALGVGLAMDDFGMGHASLLHLRRFRVAAIKVDGSLSRDVMTHPVSADIIRAIATLGHAGGARVIAEFVETREQRDLLATLGCNVFQGYLYSRALPASECLEYLLQARGAVAEAAAAELR
ncbi:MULTISPECIES: EAL domain-containing protein [unclassified Rubrivivax]|uniref:EAL domain-containing protein n=1 Tax=unclassified Rubrivivax TaxID=2649762 RepID=UPI001E634E0A|nr:MULTISPECIES: EAL domain-containing protein [unclassified Rubrivivax]MCC9595264.1 EAL domain-containing protein [Rubrivivax sp. JA1055]MCC9647945.1 EAL domain-containing protein [Rubrivivax sp. JA1029]